MPLGCPTATSLSSVTTSAAVSHRKTACSDDQDSVIHLTAAAVAALDLASVGRFRTVLGEVAHIVRSARLVAPG